jgi:anti-sigma B factor antagonist
MGPITVTEKGGVFLVILDAAALNEGQAAVIRQSLYPLITSTPGPLIALDVSAIDYLSSTGIAILIGTKRRVEAAGGRLAIFGLHPDILELFTTMKLVTLFEIVEDEDQAMELLSPSTSH